MFEVPKRYRPPTRTPKKAVSWRSYVGAKTTCDDCVRELNRGEGSRLEHAHLMRVTAEGREYLCYQHAYDRKASDAAAGVQ